MPPKACQNGPLRGRRLSRNVPNRDTGVARRGEPASPRSWPRGAAGDRAAGHDRDSQLRGCFDGEVGLRRARSASEESRYDREVATVTRQRASHHRRSGSRLGSVMTPARPGRFELPTTGSVDQCSIQLSYGRPSASDRRRARHDTRARFCVNGQNGVLSSDPRSYSEPESRQHRKRFAQRPLL